jgi:hypothetical protein
MRTSKSSGTQGTKPHVLHELAALFQFPAKHRPRYREFRTKASATLFAILRKDPAALGQDPAEEEPWLHESGGMGDFELCAFDRASVAVTRSHPRSPTPHVLLVLSRRFRFCHEIVLRDSAAQANHRPAHRSPDGALRQRRLLPPRRRLRRRGAPRAGGCPRPAGARDPRRSPLQVDSPELFPISPLAVRSSISRFQRCHILLFPSLLFPLLTLSPFPPL